MKILFDQGTPVPLRRFLPGHTVETAYERGWSELNNGKLLSRAEQEGYALLITTDRNLRYEQNLANRSIAIAVLMTTSWPRIKQHTDRIQAIVDAIQPGTYQEIPIE
ncbi:MAG: hypothetical protein AAF827_00025 [Cyanobacteria bacterium P01_D01_bin.6]